LIITPISNFEEKLFKKKCLHVLPKELGDEIRGLFY
jgi:hypothetical protein